MAGDQPNIYGSPTIEEIIKKYEQNSDPASKESTEILKDVYRTFGEKAPDAIKSLEKLLKEFRVSLNSLDRKMLKNVGEYVEKCINPKDPEYKNKIENLKEGLELLSRFDVRKELAGISLYIEAYLFGGGISLPPRFKEILNSIIFSYFLSDADKLGDNPDKRTKLEYMYNKLQKAEEDVTRHLIGYMLRKPGEYAETMYAVRDMINNPIKYIEIKKEDIKEGDYSNIYFDILFNKSICGDEIE
jgi:Sec-independent protein translocase protein TatA